MSQATSPRRILILDDDEIVRDLLDALLAGEGFSVTLASSSDEALQLLSSSAPFDTVLTDLRMPGLEGEALAHALRSALPPRSALIAMSATEPAAQLRSHFDGFLPKPFDLQLLRDVVASAQGKRVTSELLPEGDPMPAGNATATASEVLDEKIFGSLASMIPPPQLHELFSIMLKDIEKRRSSMLEAAAVPDLPALQREAHAIKGSCGMMGALELQKLAATLEAAPVLDPVALEEIPRACNRLKRILDSKFPH